jgi:adenosylcobinamide-phosphate synthase
MRGLWFVIGVVGGPLNPPMLGDFELGGVLVGALLLDRIVGDPWSWLHPVQVMGWVIKGYSDWVLNIFKGAIARRFAGVILLLLLMLGSGFVGWGFVAETKQLHAIAGLLVAMVMLASCFAGRSLRDAAAAVLEPLEAGDLAGARSQLSRYVGRDTAELDYAEILRAVTETVAENSVDGVMAPLFWAIVGMFTPLGPVPFAFGYKAVSTLDSMVGYLREPYRDLGWASANMDDLLTWIPCRLTVLSLAVFSGQFRQVWAVCAQDGPKDPSPNSGWSEAAYAAVLQVQLGGVNTYQGVVREKPILGKGGQSLSPEIVRQALRWNRVLILSWGMVAIAIYACINRA